MILINNFFTEIKKSIIPLRTHEIITGAIVANADDESVTLDEIDNDISKQVNHPSFKDDVNEDMQEFESYLGRVSYVMIKRYWGQKTAEIFK